MSTATYQSRRHELLEYFDRTAVDAWKRLTSDAPVNIIRATVRAGREEMRQTLLSWLPIDLRGTRVLDAGCGTGALAVEAARRGAHVVAIDLSPTLIKLARERLPRDTGDGTVDFMVGDMLDPMLARFDHVVAMDSLIHYGPQDAVHALAELARRTERSLLLTFAPRTPVLAFMHAVGRWFPRAERAPAIEPVRERELMRHIDMAGDLSAWCAHRAHRVARGFYISQALEVVHR
jgi:magnesium-protoporphyrin O-methyltransferase